jgi:hypothetical protein
MPSAAALRKRRYRSRQRDGVVCLRVLANEELVAAALIESGLLSEDEALDKAKVEVGVAKVLQEWTRRWFG